MAKPMKSAAFIMLSLLATVLLSCASGHHEPFKGDTPVVRDLDALAAKLQAFCDQSSLLSLEQAGQVDYEGFRAPIWVVHYRPPGAERRVLVTGGVHGNEPAGCAWVTELVGMLAERPQPYANVRFDLIPLVNPWGWTRNIRYNREGLDINRDFASFQTQEARILESLFDAGGYDLAIDHHEDPDAEGFYLYQYAKRDVTVSRSVIEQMRKHGYPIEQDVRMVILRTRDGLIDAPGWGLRYMRLTGQLSITNYLRLTHSRDVYTIETPTYLPMEDRLHMHRRAFQLIFGGVAE